MSLPNPPKQLLDYLRNGKAVCFDHHRRRCDICCVDFTYGESDEEDPYGFDNEDGSQGFMSGDEEEHFGDGDDDDGVEGPERVFVLAKSMARFIPQWDDQILGPQNTYKIEKDYDSPPKPLPLSTVRTTYCSTCQLTWLIGEIGDGAAISHPSHHSYSHIYCGTSRSLLVFTDGACSGNGTPSARGGVGVFYGPGSKFNMSQRLTYPGTATSQKAELAAAALAMETVRSKILPERRVMVKEAKGGHDSRAVADVMGVRLVIVTDSSMFHCQANRPCSANILVLRLHSRRHVSSLLKLEGKQARCAGQQSRESGRKLGRVLEIEERSRKAEHGWRTGCLLSGGSGRQ